MKTKNPRLIICSRGHRFYKSSACPVCPKCWSGYYRRRLGGNLPSTLSAPALRGLLKANITTLEEVAKYSDAELAALHGVGPRALAILRQAAKRSTRRRR